MKNLINYFSMEVITCGNQALLKELRKFINREFSLIIHQKIFINR